MIALGQKSASGLSGNDSRGCGIRISRCYSGLASGAALPNSASRKQGAALALGCFQACCRFPKRELPTATLRGPFPEVFSGSGFSAANPGLYVKRAVSGQLSRPSHALPASAETPGSSHLCELAIQISRHRRGQRIEAFAALFVGRPRQLARTGSSRMQAPACEPMLTLPRKAPDGDPAYAHEVPARDNRARAPARLGAPSALSHSAGGRLAAVASARRWRHDGGPPLKAQKAAL